MNNNYKSFKIIMKSFKINNFSVCRFTPADLMVVVKTLGYRQFSFLLSTPDGGVNGPASGSVTDDSDESETETDDDEEVSLLFDEE